MTAPPHSGVAGARIPGPSHASSAGIHLPVEATLDRCIKCNICVTACPVAAVTDLFPGPKYEGPQAGRFRQPSKNGAPIVDLEAGVWVLADPDDPHQLIPDHSVDYCSGCRVCNMVCPTGVRIAEINARARAAMVDGGMLDPVSRVRNNLLARPDTLGKAGWPLGRVINFCFESPFARIAAEKLFRIDRRAPLPTYSGGRFSQWFRRRPRSEAVRGTVVYFTGCSTEWYEARVGRTAVRLLEHLGFEVLVPEQNCCGLPLLSNGEFPAARRYHDGNIEKLTGFAERGLPIVGTSTSCTLTLKEEAPELLDAYGEQAMLLAGRTFDICEFLRDLIEEEVIAPDFLPLPISLAYHPPCQYRAHRLGLPALDLMELIPQFQVSLSPAVCCGIAGTYGYKAEKYEIAMDVGKPLFEFVEQVGGPVAVCDSETCRWQITHATNVPAVHPIEVLAAAWGAEIEAPLADVLRLAGVPGG